jgi:hypothetical protein
MKFTIIVFIITLSLFIKSSPKFTKLLSLTNGAGDFIDMYQEGVHIYKKPDKPIPDSIKIAAKDVKPLSPEIIKKLNERIAKGTAELRDQAEDINVILYIKYPAELTSKKQRIYKVYVINASKVVFLKIFHNSVMKLENQNFYPIDTTPFEISINALRLSRLGSLDVFEELIIPIRNKTKLNTNFKRDFSITNKELRLEIKCLINFPKLIGIKGYEDKPKRYFDFNSIIVRISYIKFLKEMIFSQDKGKFMIQMIFYKSNNPTESYVFTIIQTDSGVYNYFIELCSIYSFVICSGIMP